MSRRVAKAGAAAVARGILQLIGGALRARNPRGDRSEIGGCSTSVNMVSALHYGVLVIDSYTMNNDDDNMMMISIIEDCQLTMITIIIVIMINPYQPITILFHDY